MYKRTTPFFFFFSSHSFLLFRSCNRVSKYTYLFFFLLSVVYEHAWFVLVCFIVPFTYVHKMCWLTSPTSIEFFFFYSVFSSFFSLSLVILLFFSLFSCVNYLVRLCLKSKKNKQKGKKHRILEIDDARQSASDCRWKCLTFIHV